VYLTMAHLPHNDVRARFPLIAGLCLRVGLDLATDRIPVSPAAHYLMGGVATDLDGRTSVPGLFAAGEVASTGVHGANRLASNSLLEGLVFGARAGDAMRGWSARDWPAGAPGVVRTPERRDADGPSRLTEAAVRDLMWTSVGVFRDREGLARALALLDATCRAPAFGQPSSQPFDAAAWRLLSLATVGSLIARAALRREESRGAHWRADFPSRDDLHWKRHVEESLTTI
jgi:L-aspartate oxidase